MVVHHCIIRLNIVALIEFKLAEFILAILLVLRIENHIKYSGHDTSSALGIIWSINHVNDCGGSIFDLSWRLHRSSDALESSQNKSSCIGSVTLDHSTVKVFFKFSSTDFDIFALLDIICEGSAPAAARVIVDVSISNAVKNQLAWIHTPATISHNKLLFSVVVILPFHVLINHLNIVYTK